MRTFTKKAFSCIGVMIADREAILEVIKIAKHPVFGKTIHIIKIFTEEAGTVNIDNTDPRIFNIYHVRKEHLAAWESGAVMPLLTTLFAQLRRHSKVQQVHVTDSRFRNSRPLKSKYCKGHHIRAHSKICDRDELARDLHCVLEALCVSGLQFERLDMLHPTLCVAYHIGINDETVSSFRELLPQLTEINVAVQVQFGDTVGHGGLGQLGEPSCKTIDAIASLATKLKSIRFLDKSLCKGDFYNPPEIVDAVGWHVQRLLRQPPPALQKLVLEEGCMEVAELAAMLNNQSTITELIFLEYNIVNSNDIVAAHGSDPYPCLELALQESLGIGLVYLDDKTASKFDELETTKHADRAAELQEAIEAHELEQMEKAQETAAYLAWLDEKE